MHRSLRLVVAAVAAAVAVHPASAGNLPTTTFNFSYTFSSVPDVVSGSFDGFLNNNGTISDTSDDFVEFTSNINASYNGVALRGPLFVNGYDGNGFRADLPGRVNFTASSNGFMIANCNSLASCIGQSTAQDYNYFIMRTGGSPNVQFYNFTGAGQQERSEPSITGGVWSLVLAPVPEAGTASLLLAGLACTGLLLRRRAA